MAEEAFNYLYYYFLNKIMLIHTFDFFVQTYINGDSANDNLHSFNLLIE